MTPIYYTPNCARIVDHKHVQINKHNMIPLTPLESQVFINYVTN